MHGLPGLASRGQGIPGDLHAESTGAALQEPLEEQVRPKDVGPPAALAFRRLPGPVVILPFAALLSHGLELFLGPS